MEYILLFSPLKSSLHDEMGERKLKGFLSIRRRGFSKQSSCYGYMPVLQGLHEELLEVKVQPFCCAR